ncbi:MAG: hypothetical protein MZW92_65925 [Comamonadaceae bacterium]|nr:hypothetical protein [Comamonadaceae bacterium]
MTKIVLEAVQAMLLRLALQLARDDYEAQRERRRQGVELARQAGKYTGRTTDERMHARILALRAAGHSIAQTARLTPCSESKRLQALARVRSSTVREDRVAGPQSPAPVTHRPPDEEQRGERRSRCTPSSRLTRRVPQPTAAVH